MIDVGRLDDGCPYMVMEYLEGVELGSVIEREGAIDVARALRIAGQICRALAAAHFKWGYTDLPERYRDPGCTDGGPLDERPADPRFP